MLTRTTTQSPRPTRIIAGVAVIAILALGAQAVHLLEHVLQLGYWLAHPLEAPWMTPWGMAGVHLLAVGGDHATGVELLHLAGNLTFLAGLGALVIVCRAAGYQLKSLPLLRIAVYVQGLHVLEHLVLVSTVLFTGEAVGASTLFGLVGGPVMTSWRVWFHFLINLAASWYAARALLDLRGTTVRSMLPVR